MVQEMHLVGSFLSLFPFVVDSLLRVELSFKMLPSIEAIFSLFSFDFFSIFARSSLAKSHFLLRNAISISASLKLS